MQIGKQVVEKLYQPQHKTHNHDQILHI